MVRYGILGFGHHAEKRLMPGFNFARNSQPTAFWRQNLSKVRDIELRFGIRGHATVESLCSADDVDALFVTSPDALHLEHAEIAFRCGKPVLCEKPMAMNASECERMIAAAQSSGQALGVAHVMRFEESVNTAREWVASGMLGEVLHARAEFIYPGYGSPRNWITDAKLACGGPTADVGVHCFDTLRYVLQQEVQSVGAIMRNGENARVEASAEITLEFTAGALANVFVSTRAPYRTSLQVVGSKRTLESRNCFYVEGPIEIVLWEEQREVERVQCDNSRAYGIQFDAFSEALEGGAPFPCSGEDGLKNQRIIDAAYESARHGQRARL